MYYTVYAMYVNYVLLNIYLRIRFLWEECGQGHALPTENLISILAPHSPAHTPSISTNYWGWYGTCLIIQSYKPHDPPSTA